MTGETDIQTTMNDELKEIVDDFSVEKEDAEEILEIMEDLGVDTEDAYEIWEAGY